jgi:hypothetical protein
MWNCIHLWYWVIFFKTKMSKESFTKFPCLQRGHRCWVLPSYSFLLMLTRLLGSRMLSKWRWSKWNLMWYLAQMISVILGGEKEHLSMDTSIPPTSKSRYNFTYLEASSEYISHILEIKSPPVRPSLLYPQTGLYLFALNHPLVYKNHFDFPPSITFFTFAGMQSLRTMWFSPECRTELCPWSSSYCCCRLPLTMSTFSANHQNECIVGSGTG